MKNMTLNPETRLKELFGYGISGEQYAQLFAEEFTVSDGKHGDTYYVHMNDDSVSDIVLPKRFFRPKEEEKEAREVPETPDDGLDFVQVTVNGVPYYSERTELREFRRHQKAYVNEYSGNFIDYDEISIKLKKRRKNNA